MDNSYFPERPIPLAEQIAVMKRHFPGFQKEWHKNIVQWVGELQPGELSQRYRIKIVHQLHRHPAVYVLKPELTADEDGWIPHTYPGKRLCLFHPQRREWSQQRYVATTIVPWTSLWLRHYEFWQATGEWLGGGEHPESRRLGETPLQIARSLV
jgi:hypothetical protein